MNRLVVVAATLVVGALAVVAGVTATTGRLAPLGVQLGGAGWLLLVATVLWRPVLLVGAMVGLAWPIAIAAIDGHAGTGAIVVATVLLVVTGELAGWAIDRRSVVPENGAVAGRRVRALAGVAGGSTVVSAGVLAATGLPAPGGALPVAAGTVAALAVLAFAALRRW